MLTSHNSYTMLGRDITIAKITKELDWVLKWWAQEFSGMGALCAYYLAA